MMTADTAIIETLAYLSKKSRKNYALPSQEGILKLLMRFHGVVISRSTLNRHLKVLVNEGYIKRVRRIKAGPGRIPRFQSTLYWVLKRAYQFFRKQAEFLRRIGFKLTGAVKSWKKETPGGALEKHNQGWRLSPEENLVFLRKFKLSLNGCS